MSWPPNQAPGGNSSHRLPGDPGPYNERRTMDDAANAHQTPNYPPWLLWPTTAPPPPPPQGMSMLFAGAPFAYPHHQMGYGMMMHSQQWGGPLPSSRVGQVQSMIPAPPRSAAAAAPPPVAVWQQHPHPQPQPHHELLSEGQTDAPHQPLVETDAKLVDDGPLELSAEGKDHQRNGAGIALAKSTMDSEEVFHKRKEWANTLVGCDWEIFWSNDEEKQAQTKHDDESKQDNEGDSVDSIIDDWYDGRILSADIQKDGTVQGRIVFLGDETVYEMVLMPSMVRPSARAWIKQTTALLLGKDKECPPDTSSPKEQHLVETIEDDSLQYEPLLLPSKSGIGSPTVEELNNILSLRTKLKSQIHLRSKLASIVNLHGSVKYVGGELNPTESLVNHLVECCNDIDLACTWYLRCWELLRTFFGLNSGRSSNNTQPSQELQLNYTLILDDYLDFGKNCILNCATFDTESTSSKRRQLVASPGQRRRKRRRKLSSWNNENDCDAVREIDFRSTSAVDQFARRLSEEIRWYLPLLSRMLQALSHHVVDPLIRWMCQANLLLGKSDDLVVLLEEVEEDRASLKFSSQIETQEDAMSVATSSSECLFSHFHAVEACIDALKHHQVLSLVDLSETKQDLCTKLQVVTNLAKQANLLLDHVSEECPQMLEHCSKHDGDEVLCGLQEIARQLESPEHSAHNIDPVGFGQVMISREEIDDAILWRRFLLDVWHMSSHRERKQFIEDLAVRMEGLPNPSGFAWGDIRETVERQVREKVKSSASVAGVESKYEELLLNSQIGAGLFARHGLMAALEELRSLPVLLCVEEKLALRLNYIQWSERATEILTRNKESISFSLLENLYDMLHRILKGKSELISDNLEKSEKIENTISVFIEKDSIILDSIRRERVVQLYLTSSQWKERADAVLSALRMHGNTVAGEAIPTTKLPSLVDLKRVRDLVVEYKDLAVDIPGYILILQGVLDNAAGWSSRLQTNLLREQSIHETAHVLAEENQCRPRGLIMDPTRQVLDMVGDLLHWHRRSTEMWGNAIAILQTKDIMTVGQALSELIRTQVYPLLAEGVDVVELYSHYNCDQYGASAALSAMLLEKLNIRGSAKALNRQKIITHPFGEKMLNRIVKKEFDLVEGSPVALHLWADWHLSMASFLGGVEGSGQGSSRATLTQALLYRSKEPGQSQDFEPIAVGILYRYESTEKAQLRKLIKEAEGVETASHELLSLSRDLRKGCVEKSEFIRGHLAALKNCLSIIKERSSGNQGLVLDPTLESLVEYDVKLFAWLVKTLPYRFLYLDEASYAMFSQDDARIPLDVLVSLSERCPHGDDTVIDDFALVSMRVDDLYKNAMKWQDEITRSTLLSNRGGKRRNQGLTPTKELDQESSSKLQIERIQQLADYPILSKVVMPREIAVKTILQKSKEFEMKLHAFLKKDVDINKADRKSYPSGRSLVERGGEFVLFRLTGSELFESVLEVMHELAAIDEDVFAETPEKVTFEWIQRGVTWIAELNEAVTRDSPFASEDKHYFTVPEDKAKNLLERGTQIFSEVPRDLKTTLSQHGIVVSTSKIDQIIKVVSKKDGALHSVGGTVMRWCPILLKCLKSDLSKLNMWKKEVQSLTCEVDEYFWDGDVPSDEQAAYVSYRLRERATYLLEKGARSLVVAPKPGVVAAFKELSDCTKRMYHKASIPEFDRKFSRMWFLEGRSVLDQRFILLESLLYRQFLDVSRDDVPLPADGQKTFRDTCRSILMDCFMKALKTVGMHHFFMLNVLESFCSIRSWEIENEMFDQYQDSLGAGKASQEYTKKCRNLKASLKENNHCMCLEILLGDVTAQMLLRMSSNELASQTVKAARTRAEEGARNAALLVTGSEKSPSRDKRTGPSARSDLAKPISILRTAKVAASPAVETDTAINFPTASSEDENSTGSPPGDEHATVARAEFEMSEAAIALKLAAARSSLPPPPPPSLLNAFKSPVQDESEYGNRISCKSGGDEFQFDIVNLGISCRTSLYLEDSKLCQVDRFLPEVFTQKGRLSVEKFSSWISDKRGSGRWVVIALRLVPLSEDDHLQLNKLSKSYESMNRIVMITPTSDTNIFVLTPKFHAAAEETHACSFGDRLSCYAVVLTKDSRFV